MSNKIDRNYTNQTFLFSKTMKSNINNLFQKNKSGYKIL